MRLDPTYRAKVNDPAFAIMNDTDDSDLPLDHARYQPRFLHEADGVGVVAAEMKGRRNSRSDHLAVAAFAFGVFSVARTFENIVDDYVQVSGFCDYFYRVGHGSVGFGSQH